MAPNIEVRTNIGRFIATFAPSQKTTAYCCYGYINLIAEDEWPQRAAPSDLGSIYCGTILFITFKVPPVSVRQHSVRPKRQIGVANRSPVSSRCLSFFSRYFVDATKAVYFRLADMKCPFVVVISTYIGLRQVC